jgi:glutamate/tyrosine decarboxylase-like PLP-dependent enzyme
MTSAVGPLRRAADVATAFLAAVAERPVGSPVDLAALRVALGGPLPANGEDATAVIDRLAVAAEPGIVATAGPRYFGFVIGGAHPAALAADWLAAAWDQNACLYVMSPAAAVVEEIAAAWLVELFGLPAQTSVGFTTGATMASFTALAAARHAVLETVGWDVEEQGLTAAPCVHVLNDVVLNQVLVRFAPADGGDPDAHTRTVIAHVQADGTCWVGGTTWQGRAAMRISVSSWSTTDDDIQRSAAAILRCAAAAGR